MPAPSDGWDESDHPRALAAARVGVMTALQFEAYEASNPTIAPSDAEEDEEDEGEYGDGDEDEDEDEDGAGDGFGGEYGDDANEEADEDEMEGGSYTGVSAAAAVALEGMFQAMGSDEDEDDADGFGGGSEGGGGTEGGGISSASAGLLLSFESDSEDGNDVDADGCPTLVSAPAASAAPALPPASASAEKSTTSTAIPSSGASGCRLLQTAASFTGALVAAEAGTVGSAPSILALSDHDKTELVTNGFSRLESALAARRANAAAAVLRLGPAATNAAAAAGLDGEEWRVGAVRKLWEEEQALLDDLLVRVRNESSRMND